MKVVVSAYFPGRRGSWTVVLAQKLVVQPVRQDAEDLYWVLWVRFMLGLCAQLGGARG